MSTKADRVSRDGEVQPRDLVGAQPALHPLLSHREAREDCSRVALRVAVVQVVDRHLTFVEACLLQKPQAEKAGVEVEIVLRAPAAVGVVVDPAYR